MIASRYRVWLEAGDPVDLEPELAPLLPALRAQARRRLPQQGDAEDAVQDAVLELLRSRCHLPPELPLPAVARRLVEERMLMRGRVLRRRRCREMILYDEHSAAMPDKLTQVDFQLLDRLEPIQQRILRGIIARVDRKTLATQEGISLGKLAVLCHRARRRLASPAARDA